MRWYDFGYCRGGNIIALVELATIPLMYLMSFVRLSVTHQATFLPVCLQSSQSHCRIPLSIFKYFLSFKKTICANKILIQTEKDKVDSAKEELRNFKQEIEHWYPGICANVDFADRCSKYYRIKDEIIRQLLNGERVVCSG